jgi:hypothetical protein
MFLHLPWEVGLFLLTSFLIFNYLVYCRAEHPFKWPCLAPSFGTMKRIKWRLRSVKSAMVVKREPSWYGRMERMILSKTDRNVATLASVACTRNKPTKRRRPNLRPSASLLVERKVNGRKAMFNKFLKRTLFLTVASTTGIMGSVYGSTHRTRKLQAQSPRVQGQPSFTTQPNNENGLLALAAVALPSSHSEGDGHGQWWNSDSKIVGVDDRCSACIYDRESDFVEGTLVSVNRTIKGFAGSRTSLGIKMGMIRWRIQDNNG